MGKILREFKTVLLAVLFAFLFAGVFSCGAQTLGEAVDAPNFVWSTGGDSIWTVQTTNTHDGIDAASSGIVDSNQTSWIETTVIGPATVRYWIRVGSEGFSSVFARFTVNENQEDYLVPSRFIDSPWSNEIYDLGDGTNVLRLSVFNRTNNHDFVVLDEFIVEPPRPLTIEYQPADQTVFSGATAFFDVSVFGTPPIRFQWQKDGMNLLDATNSWLLLENTSTNDGGVYSVTVSNAQNSLLSTNALLTVLPPSAPNFYYEPENSTVYTGQTFSLSCGVDGSQPFTYQWRKEGTNLPNAIWPTLYFTNISQADAGNYTLVVSNAIGGIESSNIVVTVIQSVAPVITRHPRSLEVAAGASTWMEIEASGTPDPTCKWTKEGEIPPPSNPWPPRPQLPPLPGFGSNLRRAFTNVSAADAGIYFATASNSGGVAVSRPALLTVLPPLNLKGSWSQGAEDIFVTNGLAFLAQGTNGLAILNVSNVASPQFLGSYDTPGYALAVRVSDGTAYVADSSAGLQILNVNDPSNPAFIGAYNTSGYTSDVIVRSNLAFVAAGNVGLVILNVSNPASPTFVGSYSTNLRAISVCLSGNLAFVGSPAPDIDPGTHIAGMLVIDISDPAHPTELGRLGGGVRAMDAKENFVIATSGSSVEIISISDPAHPIVIGSFWNYFRALVYDVQAMNDLVYVAADSEDQPQLLVLNIREPARPVPVGKFTLSENANDIFVESNLVYVTGENLPLQIIETPFTAQPFTKPFLSIANQNGLKLQCQGGRGFNYTIEESDDLNGSPWLPVQTVLLTNDNSVIELPAPSATKFFRLRQLD